LEDDDRSHDEDEYLVISDFFYVCLQLSGALHAEAAKRAASFSAENRRIPAAVVYIRHDCGCVVCIGGTNGNVDAHFEERDLSNRSGTEYPHRNACQNAQHSMGIRL
jgi:hypothetical protein